MTADDLLDLTLKSLSREGGPHSVETVGKRVDEFLTLFSDLRDERDRIVSKTLEILVTSIGQAQELVDPNGYEEWLEKHDKTQWRLWPWLSLYLKEKLRRPSAILEELDRSSDRVLELLGDPMREGLWDRRGLVVGHVQSGKTQHYTALTAKAIDAGYKLIIILSGIHENLRQQTQERIEECITGKNSRDGFQAFGCRKFAETFKSAEAPATEVPDVNSMTSAGGDFNSATNQNVSVAMGTTPVVLVIKKNVSILRNVLEKIRGSAAPYKAFPYPTLVIDDEADHSSINTAKTDPDTDPTRINELIRKILWSCDKVGFVGYTATPYANIFMEDQWREKSDSRKLDDVGSDLFPRAFIIGLQAPDNYIGPDTVFGHDGDESLGIPAKAPLAMYLPADDADNWLPPKHKSNCVVKANLPGSLVQALRIFVISVAARAAIGQTGRHCSMLIHVTRFNAVQEQVMNQVKPHVEGLRTRLESNPDREAEWSELEALWISEPAAKFQSFFDHPSQRLDPPRLPEWQEVRENIIPALSRIRFSKVNSQSKEDLDFAGNKNGLTVIAVGGDRLSRGLTLEGLTVSYFLRGAKAYDTLMQMGRWFGYRPGYAQFCRVYAPREIVVNFKTIALATEELRQEFARMSYLRKTPKDYGLKVREPRADLLVTALNKMRRGESIKVHFGESLISSLEIPVSALAENYAAFRRLIDTLEAVGVREKGVPAKGTSVSWVWKDMPWDTVSGFFSAYSANSNPCLTQTGMKSLLQIYIENVQRSGDLDKWTIAVIGSGKRGEPAIPGKDYLTVNRNRENDLHPENIRFQAVAMGSDESLDLSPEEAREALLFQKEYGKSLASAFRAARPSNRGLLLIYPIRPQFKDDDQPSDPELSPWNCTEPVIGIAVSLPGSRFDQGCDYVCNPTKMRELFGKELTEDLYRDEEEENLANL